MTEQQQLEAAIAALEGQRSTLGDAVVDSLLEAAAAKLAALTHPGGTPSFSAQTPWHVEPPSSRPMPARF